MSSGCLTKNMCCPLKWNSTKSPYCSPNLCRNESGSIRNRIRFSGFLLRGPGAGLIPISSGVNVEEVLGDLQQAGGVPEIEHEEGDQVGVANIVGVVLRIAFFHEVTADFEH